MASRSHNYVPTALEPYLRIQPRGSLTLLTDTLECCGSWLATKFARVLLGAQVDGVETGLVIVSFVRDEHHWSNELRRTTGIDSTKLVRSGRLVIVDSTSKQALTDWDVAVRQANANASDSGKRVVNVLLDNPDVLLALGLANAASLSSFVLQMRSLAYTVIITCAADQPLLAAALAPPGHMDVPLETQCASFVVQQAHVARWVLSVRQLETGAAHDVSGVLRITRGGGDYGLYEVEGEMAELEMLFLIQRDGTARVFERGEST
ncbi:hypothetical protein K470DRAFT_281495 [Piedraia hortae CBS 480.64]|uniref:Elongator complex protein 6 n=1 Tax=Piedraia hortae CBS 480.64 TaxID=1314780 RepID=A0A6A7C2H3_9PEZI|nr:hypothetical protein K470DRAFT_281495 [Piedraia hortae CBS 480.64]